MAIELERISRGAVVYRVGGDVGAGTADLLNLAAQPQYTDDELKAHYDCLAKMNYEWMRRVDKGCSYSYATDVWWMDRAAAIRSGKLLRDLPLPAAPLYKPVAPESRAEIVEFFHTPNTATETSARTEPDYDALLAARHRRKEEHAAKTLVLDKTTTALKIAQANEEAERPRSEAIARAFAAPLDAPFAERVMPWRGKPGGE